MTITLCACTVTHKPYMMYSHIIQYINTYVYSPDGGPLSLLLVLDDCDHPEGSEVEK